VMEERGYREGGLYVCYSLLSDEAAPRHVVAFIIAEKARERR
jgi:hypothetical protein